MRVAILGAGAVGPICAVLAARRGHEAVLFSPSGAGTRGIAGRLRAEGLIAAEVPVAVAATLAEALAGADAALLAVPAHAHAALLPRIAAALPDSLPLVLTPALSLAPLVLDGLRAGLGGAPGRAPIGAMATTPAGGRRSGPDAVRVTLVRSEVPIAALPAAAAAEMGALVQDLFGTLCPAAANVLEVALGNANPITHGALALANLTRMERAEAWNQYEMMTPAVCRLMEALDAERAALAAAWGVRVDGVAAYLHRANGVPLAPLAEMTAAIAASAGAVMGPTAVATRYLAEDIPFGLSAWLRLAAPKGVAMPVTASVVTALAALSGLDLAANPLLDGLDPAALGGALEGGIGRG
jgi:opine dehydrogenase